MPRKKKDVPNPKAPGPKRDEDKRIEDRQEIARMARFGYKQREIAARFNISQQMVSRELKLIKQEYIKSAQLDAKAMLGEQIAAHKDIINEAYKAWLKSWEDEEYESDETKTVAYTGGEEGNESMTSSKHVRTRKGRVPGAEYLRTIQASFEAIAKLYGLYGDSPILPGVSINIDWQALASGTLPNPHKELEDKLRALEVLPPAEAPDASSIVVEMEGGSSPETPQTPHLNGKNGSH